MKLKTFISLVFASVICSLFALSVSADDLPTWGQYDFNEPKFVSVDDLDLTHQYFYQPSLTGNSGSVSSFPSFVSGSFNSYYLNTDLLYNNRYSTLPVASPSVSGYKYLSQSVQSMPAGDYVMLFTVYSSSSSYAGSYWYLTSYPGLESYITHYYRNGVLFESAVAYVPKEAGVYHFEVYITVPEDTQTCITYTYGYERVEYYYFDTVGTYSNPAFNGMVIYRVKDLPQTSFTLDVSALRDNTLLRSVTLYGGVTLFGVFFGTVSVAIIAGHLIPFLSPQERAAVSKNSKDGTKLNADYVYVNGRYIRRRSY